MPASWPQRVTYSVLTGAPPVIWTALDWWATGDPKFSLTHTSGLAEELGRTSGGLSAVPSTTVKFLKNLDKVPVFYAGILGVVIAVLLTPRRARMPLALLVIGLGTFVLVGLAGLSVIDRYLLVPSLLVMVFAGVALGGWTMLRAGRARTLWAVGSVALIVYGVAFTATRVNFSTFTNELTFRGDSHASLRTLLNDPKVRAGLRCGPVSTPNHKLIPDTRWLLDASAAQGHRPQRRARALAHRPRRGHLRGQPPVAAALGLHRRRRVDAGHLQLDPDGGVHAGGVHAVLQRLCPLLSGRP